MKDFGFEVHLGGVDRVLCSQNDFNQEDIIGIWGFFGTFYKSLPWKQIFFIEHEQELLKSSFWCLHCLFHQAMLVHLWFRIIIKYSISVRCQVIKSKSSLWLPNSTTGISSLVAAKLVTHLLSREKLGYIWVLIPPRRILNKKTSSWPFTIAKIDRRSYNQKCLYIISN